MKRLTATILVWAALVLALTPQAASQPFIRTPVHVLTNGCTVTLGASATVLQTDCTTKTLRAPVVTTAQRDAMTPSAGDLIFNVTTSQHEFFDGTTWEGAGGAFLPLAGGTLTGDLTLDDAAGDSPATVFVPGGAPGFRIYGVGDGGIFGEFRIEGQGSVLDQVVISGANSQPVSLTLGNGDIAILDGVLTISEAGATSALNGQRLHLAQRGQLFLADNDASVNTWSVIAPTSFSANRTCTLGDTDNPLDACITVGTASVNGLITAARVAKLDGIASGATVGATWSSNITGQPSVIPQAEAEAGVATTERIWTAERVKQAIAALPPANHATRHHSGGGDEVDHGSISGLGDDDHAQYALLAGRATGQIITGGTGASETLRLRSTSHATIGPLRLQDLGGNVSIGLNAATPQGILHVHGPTNSWVRVSTTATGSTQNDGAIFGYSSGELTLTTLENEPIVIYTNGMERGRWLNTGGLQVTGNITSNSVTLPTTTVSQAEAQAGTATTNRLWTAERVKQAIAALPPANHAARHVNGTDDVQNATASQKGLMTTAYASKLDGVEAGATADQTATHSIEFTADAFQLVGDLASPGINKVYGTDGAGTRTWKDDPAGGSGEVNTISSQGGALALTAATPKVGVDLRVVSAAAADFDVATDVLSIDAAIARDSELPVGANPTATVALTATNGSATTFMRSDAAPALSQSIAPVWTATHTFESLANFDGSTEGTLRLPSSTTLPASCTVGDTYWDTDADIDGSLYVCRLTNVWKEVDDDGAGVGGAPVDATYFVNTTNPTLSAEIVVQDLNASGEIVLDDDGNPTVDGQLSWDTTSELLKVGDDGVATYEFHPGAHTTDTGPSPDCSGTSTYQDGEGGCDSVGGDLSGGLDAASVVSVAGATTDTEAPDDNTTQVASTAFVQQELNGAGGTNLTCSAGVCNVDDAFVTNSGDAISGNLDFNDGVGDSPQAVFTPQTGTLWRVYVENVGDDLLIESASNNATERVSIINPHGSGVAELEVEGNITSANFNGTFSGTFSGTSSGTNTGDQSLSTSSAGLDVSGHAVDLDVTPGAANATLEQADDAVQVRHDGSLTKTASGLSVVTHAGTNIQADLEEEAHAAEHEGNGLDVVGETLVVNQQELAVSVNAQTGTTYTLVASDQSKFVTMDNASANTLNVPTNASVAFPTGTVVCVLQKGAGTTTIQAAGGVTLNSVSGGSKAMTLRWGQACVTKLGTDEWVIDGRVTL